MEQVNLLKHMYSMVSGLPSDEAVELPEDLTAEKMVTVVTAFFKASNNVIETVVQELLAKVRCKVHSFEEKRCAWYQFWLFPR